MEPEWIEFGNSNGDPIPPGTRFNISMIIYNVTNLYGFDIQFKWDTKYLEYVSHSVRVPVNDYPDGILYKSILP